MTKELFSPTRICWVPPVFPALYLTQAGSQELPCAPRRKSQQAEREYEKIKSQLEGLEESVRDRCKKEFTGRRVPGEGGLRGQVMGKVGSGARFWERGSS